MCKFLNERALSLERLAASSKSEAHNFQTSTPNPRKQRGLYDIPVAGLLEGSEESVVFGVQDSGVRYMAQGWRTHSQVFRIWGLGLVERRAKGLGFGVLGCTH